MTMRVQDVIDDLQVRADERSSKTEERYGQAWMNIIRTEHPDFYAAVTGTVADPFYSSSKVGRAETKLALWLVDHGGNHL
jgi:hypothetical protein